VKYADDGGDQDIWKEAITCFKDSKGEVKYRRFYFSQKSNERCWDEPPSGASKILYVNESCFDLTKHFTRQNSSNDSNSSSDSSTNKSTSPRRFFFSDDDFRA